MANFVVEKMIHLTINQEFILTEAFVKVRWVLILQLLEVYYPQLVKEFYANIEDKDDKNVLMV